MASLAGDVTEPLHLQAPQLRRLDALPSGAASWSMEWGKGHLSGRRELELKRAGMRISSRDV